MTRSRRGGFAAAMLLAVMIPARALEAGAQGQGHSGESRGRRPAPVVRALFGLKHPHTAPFPSDVFTVRDPAHVTGRRVHLPYPDCAVRVSDCDDLRVINTLDGFALQTRLSIPFSGAIDPTTVTSETVFLIRLPAPSDGGPKPRGPVIGINQTVWDPESHTLFVETNELLEEHTRYAIIVTRGVRDPSGRPVAAADSFRAFRQTAPAAYGRALHDAVGAARRVGVREREIVAASVYTTESIVPVMARIRDQVKAMTPPPARFTLGANGERALFDLAAVTSITWNQQTRTNPPSFVGVPIDLAALRYASDTVARIAYGAYRSPDYRVAGGHIPAVGTLHGTPPVRRVNELTFTLFLPSGPRPAAGWPVAIVGTGGDQHLATGLLAASFAAQRIATIGINVVGSGFGPLSTLDARLSDGRGMVVSVPGRGIDQDGDAIIGATEGAVAAPPRTWTVGVRDSNRQNAIDLWQLVRVIQVGMDVDGDGGADLDPTRIFYYGNSAGSMYGAMFLSLEPDVAAAVLGVPGALTGEHGRLAPGRRANFFGPQLRDRVPPLLNAPGITNLDGVAINPPHFDENKPLRDRPPVVNMVSGAIAIQDALALHQWGQQSGQSPLPWVRHLGAMPLPGVPRKSLLILFGRGDQNAVNPGTSAILRAGDLADRTVHYRHDLAVAEDPTLPRNPHFFVTSPTSANPLARAIAQGVQRQVALFFASNGTIVVHPEPPQFFEVPLSEPPSESLNFIP